jgi:hypothetical protein
LKTFHIGTDYLKSLGRRSTRLHLEHSAMFLSLPFSNKVFITTSPPHDEQVNLWVETVVREFLLAVPIFISLKYTAKLYHK